MNTPSLLVAAAAALLCAACADMKWTKSGADAAAVSRDLDDCRGAALRQGTTVQPAASRTAPTDRAGTPSGNRSVGSSNERFVAEHEDVRACMTQRGYRLERVQ